MFLPVDPMAELNELEDARRGPNAMMPAVAIRRIEILCGGWVWRLKANGWGHMSPGGGFQDPDWRYRRG